MTHLQSLNLKPIIQHNKIFRAIMPQIKPPQKLGFLLSFATLINRLALGTFIALIGIQKFQLGLSVFYDEKFTPLVPEWLPPYLAKSFGYSLPFIEVLMGACLVFGFFTRTAAALITLTLIAILIALTQKLGYTALETETLPFHYNYILATLAFLLLIIGPGPASIDHVLFKRKNKKSPSSTDDENDDDFSFE
ncbi:DoxX family protein [Planctomycetota bacterium]|nr:DoxX family protein [Planctomycetota bacterium]